MQPPDTEAKLLLAIFHQAKRCRVIHRGGVASVKGHAGSTKSMGFCTIAFEVHAVSSKYRQWSKEPDQKSRSNC